MRAFIALDVPDAVKDRLEAAEAGLDIGGVTLVKRDAMHITLQFLGDIGEREAGLAAEAMRTIAFARFTVGLRGLSCFYPDSPRVVFAKVEDGARELVGLYKELDRALSGKGLACGRERYVPHLTVARVKAAAERRGVLDAIGGFADTYFGSFEAGSIALKKSVLSGGGPSYTDLYELESGP